MPLQSRQFSKFYNIVYLERVGSGEQMEQNKQLPAFKLFIESEEFEELSEHWQRQCCLLYNNINRNIAEGSVEFSTCKAAEGERTGIIDIFSILSVCGVSPKSFGHIFDQIKMWLERKPKAKVIMKFPNGNSIEISGVTGFSKSEVLDLFEKSLEANQV